MKKKIEDFSLRKFYEALGTKYKKENWEVVSIVELKEHLKNHDKLNDLLENKIVGFTHDEHMHIKWKLEKGYNLLKKVLKDKLEEKF